MVELVVVGIRGGRHGDRSSLNCFLPSVASLRSGGRGGITFREGSKGQFGEGNYVLDGSETLYGSRCVHLEEASGLSMVKESIRGDK